MWGKQTKGYKGFPTGKGAKGDGKGKGPTANASADSWQSWQGGGIATWPEGNAVATDGWAPNQAQTSDGWTGKGGKGQPQEYVRRLEGRYAFAKAVLRPYFGEGGLPVYSPGKTAQELWEKAHLRTILDQRNTELVRRPALGLSMACSSLLGFKSVLDREAAEGEGAGEASCGKHMQKLMKIFSRQDVQPFWTACNKLLPANSVQQSRESMAKSIECWLSFLREHKTELSKSLPYIVEFASGLYLGASQALEAVTLTNALANWAGKIPSTEANKSILTKWQDKPRNVSAAKNFLTDAILLRHQADREWRGAGGTGGDSEEEEALPIRPGSPGKGKPRKSSSSTSSSTGEKKRRKKEKKQAKENKHKAEAEKKDKKKKKKTKKEKSASTSSASPSREKDAPKRKSPALESEAKKRKKSRSKSRGVRSPSAVEPDATSQENQEAQEVPSDEEAAVEETK